MKKIFYIAIIIFSILMILIYYLIISNKYNVKKVVKLPAGFISLEEICERKETISHYVFFETQILFFDSNDTCIFQANVKDSNFIVEYQNKYYINKESYLELVNEMIE